MNPIAVDTRLMPGTERIEAWRDALQGAFGPMFIDPIPGEDFEGELRSTRRGPLVFHDMCYGGMRLWRRPIDVAKMHEEFFTLTLPGSGLEVEQRGQTLQLLGGQAYLFNHAVTYRTRPPSPYRTRSIAFPASLLRLRVRDLQPFYALDNYIATSGGLSLIRSFADHLSQGAVNWSDHEFTALSDQFLDLLGLFLQTGNANVASAESCTQAGHRQRAVHYIRIHASDPELSPLRVAQACGISLGYLHEVFRGPGMAVEQKIFEERLELARRLLIDPRRKGVPIQTLAYEAGFSDPAHFSRRFKRRFGVTPGELRAEQRTLVRPR